MDVITELQQQRESLKQNIHDMDESIKKLTGRDPTERRQPPTKHVQLKRNSFGLDGDSQPNKRFSSGRRWGNTSFNRPNDLDSGGEEQDDKKPAVQSSVVVTGKPIEPPHPVTEDNATKKRNKRMFGLLMGTLKQFKRDCQVKTEQEAKREEKLTKVEEQVQKDKENAVVERKELFQSRRGKQQELRNLEFKIEMAELNEELKSYYVQIKDFIQLKSTPRIFYKPAEHNKKTSKLLKDSREAFQESLHQRMREIGMFTEDDFFSTTRNVRKNKPVSSGKSVKDTFIIDQAPSKRDLFAEDADIDQQERGDFIMEYPFDSVLITEDISVEDSTVNLDRPIAENKSNVSGADKNNENLVDVDATCEFKSELSKDDVSEAIQVVDAEIYDLKQKADKNDVLMETHEDGFQIEATVKSVIDPNDDLQTLDNLHNDITSDKNLNGVECVFDKVDNVIVDEIQKELKNGDSNKDEGDKEKIGIGVELNDISEDRNIFDHFQENDKNVSDNDIVDQSIIDDSYLHDEYAAQLLEQVVDEGRAVALGNSYNVVDERVSKIDKKLALQYTKMLIDKREDVNTDTNINSDVSVEKVNSSFS